MSARSNEQKWAARERLGYIETCAWWKGIVNRNDLTNLYGVSMAQASSDMQRYLDLNPSSMNYNLRLKRYEAVSQMKCVLTKPSLNDAVTRFLAGDARSFWNQQPAEPGANTAAFTQLPTRQASDTVERRAFLAIVNGFRIRIHYANLDSGRDEWRWIRPHAIGHNGSRWHLRAWCERNETFDDFVLSRISEIEWNREKAPAPVSDTDWHEWTSLRIRPNRGLSKLQRAALERDLPMTNGTLEIPVRKAMEGHLREALGLPAADGTAFTPLFEAAK